MAAVYGPQANRVVNDRRTGAREGGGGDESSFGGDEPVAAVEEDEQRRCPMVPAVAAGEGGVGEDATPGLADDGGVGQTRGLVWWETEKDLGHGVLDQL